ncbi:MAG: pyrroline-5-carboxylate reductase [Parcubacteria group bacterium]|nr:pyrroline-5-carboxylate reductase [Parcubacteria group bacterium]
MKQKIGIIGLGNMGGAFYQGLGKIFPAEQLWGYDKNGSDKVKNFADSARDLVEQVDVVILAIKPQSLGDSAAELKDVCQSKLVISMLAGVPVGKLQKTLGAKRVVRCMPNLPIKVGQGVTGWIASAETTDDDKKLARKIFSAFGYETEVAEEKMLDAITALSGSGPAYYFYLCSVLTAQAQEMGFNEEEARAIAENTFQGAAKLLEGGNLSSEEWVQAVASKGGTTEAALDSFAQDKLDEVIRRALEKAGKRSEELS